MANPYASEKRFRRGAVIFLAGATFLAAIVVGRHFLHLSAQRTSLGAAAAAGPVVQVVRAGASSAIQTVTVLASVTPYQEATLYAKVSGYLDQVGVDKGDLVKAGQLLAVVKSQETDAQYNSARADLINKERIARRYNELLHQGAIAPLLVDQADADSRIASAILEQTATLKSYERLIAPFDGRVTARFVDPGDLVQNATTSQIAAQPVVIVSDSSKLRIDAYVQQSVAPFVHAGDTADIVDAANSGRSFRANITRVSGELDPRTRTMLVEVVIDNSRDFLLAGSFAYMTLHVPMPSAVEVPVSALVTRGSDQFVAVLGGDSRLHYVKIAIGSTDGDTVTLAGGIAPGTRLAIDLPAEASDGALVRTVQARMPR